MRVLLESIEMTLATILSPAIVASHLLAAASWWRRCGCRPGWRPARVTVYHGFVRDGQVLHHVVVEGLADRRLDLKDAVRNGQGRHIERCTPSSEPSHSLHQAFSTA
jgi:hypothetical protein